MYIEKKRMESGAYKYKMMCESCGDERWVSCTRSKRCFGCREVHELNYCVVYPTRCRICDEPRLIRHKPTVDGVSTCDKCKGHVINIEANGKKKISRAAITCSECPTVFIPKNTIVKTCSKTCSIIRKNRVKREKTLPLMSMKKKKQRRDSKFSSDRPINKVEKDRVLGGVDEKDKPVYLREHQKKSIRLKERVNKTDNEISRELVVKFFKSNRTPSVRFNNSDFLNQEGMTDQVRLG